MTVIGGYPLPLKVMGFVKISNVTLAIAGRAGRNPDHLVAGDTLFLQ